MTEELEVTSASCHKEHLKKMKKKQEEVTMMVVAAEETRVDSAAAAALSKLDSNLWFKRRTKEAAEGFSQRTT